MQQNLQVMDRILQNTGHGIIDDMERNGKP